MEKLVVKKRLARFLICEEATTTARRGAQQLPPESIVDCGTPVAPPRAFLHGAKA